MVFFKSTNVDVVALRNIEENSINEEKERLNIQELTPRKTQIEEELSKTLVINALSVEFFSFSHFFEFFLFLTAL